MGALTVLATVSTARADEKAAQKYLDRAIEYYKYARYDSAASEFKRAYREDPQPRTLFAWAQAERLAGNCEESIELYGKFLATEPPEADVEAAEFGIRACNGGSDTAIGDDSKATAESGGQGKESPDVSDPAGGLSRVGSTGSAEPWYFDRRGAVLTGTGVALTAIGFGLYLSARSLASRAGDEADNEQEFEDRISRARERRNIAVLLGLSGAALLTVGALHYHRIRNARRTSVVITPAIEANSVGIALFTRF